MKKTCKGVKLGLVQRTVVCMGSAVQWAKRQGRQVRLEMCDVNFRLGIQTWIKMERETKVL